jgi:predicted transcriptional regulator
MMTTGDIVLIIILIVVLPPAIIGYLEQEKRAQAALKEWRHFKHTGKWLDDERA